MSKLREVFDAVRAMALAAQTTYDRVLVGSMPENDSMVMLIAAGGEQTPTLDRRGDLSIDIVCNDKHASQMIAMDTLAVVHYALTTTAELPKGDGWQILDIRSSSLPTLIEYDGDQWLYGSGFEVRVWIQ